MDNKLHLIASDAPLLSGSLSDCISPDDSSCIGGIAAVAALSRLYSQGNPFLLLPYLDKQSPFVQMSPLGWNVNRLILQYIVGAKTYLSVPSILQQNKVDSTVSPRDISDLQSKDFPLLLSNVYVPPGNSWSSYQTNLFLDSETKLAVLYVDTSNERFSSPQIETVLGRLDYLARENSEAGCSNEYTSLLQNYLNTTTRLANPYCWIPVIVFGDVKDNFDSLLSALVRHKNRPALFLDIYGNSPQFEIPRYYQDAFWVVSFNLASDQYYHQVITLSDDRKSIANVTLIHHDLNLSLPTLPLNIRDANYNSTIVALAKLAAEARVNDPILAQSKSMPLHRKGTYRRCNAGPCEVGVLFTDALRWWARADIAFANSGGFRGSGWPAGPVRVSNIWDCLPFPNNYCTGVMSGVSVFNMFNYSVAMATFEGENTVTGGLLMQVSGMRLTYNTKLSGSRLIAIDIWNEDAKDYRPLDRLRLYKFATDSFTCSGHPNFMEFVNSRLVYPGEQSGRVDNSMLEQEIAAEYLKTFKSIFEPSAENRMFNDTSATTFLNLTRDSSTCTKDEFWNPDQQTCVLCPNSSGVVFLKDSMEFHVNQGAGGSALNQSSSIVNTLTYNVTVVARSMPSWITVSGRGISGEKGEGSDVKNVIVVQNLEAGSEFPLGFHLNNTGLDPGTATGYVVFGVSGESQYSGCIRPDADLLVTAYIAPPPQLNQLDNIRYVGWVLSGVVFLTSLFLIVFVMRNRTVRVVRTLQPLFLNMISSGILVMGSVLIPMSLDDEMLSVEGCSMACMATPWLLSMGFTIAMSALFSKLWRINRVFNNPTFRKIKVTEKDVLAPFGVLFLTNFAALLVWTLVDPLKWVRTEIPGRVNSSYGVCQSSNGSVALAIILVIVIVNFSAFASAVYQAYRARNISDEFSEGRNLGIALFSWVQLGLIGLPVHFLINQDNPSARYFLDAGLIFALCMTMLLFIFTPMFLHMRRAALLRKQRPTSQDPESVRQASSSRHTSHVHSKFTLNHVNTVRVSGVEHVTDSLRNSLASKASVASADDGFSPFMEDCSLEDLKEELESAVLQAEIDEHDRSVVANQKST